MAWSILHEKKCFCVKQFFIKPEYSTIILMISWKIKLIIDSIINFFYSFIISRIDRHHQRPWNRCQIKNHGPRQKRRGIQQIKRRCVRQCGNRTLWSDPGGSLKIRFRPAGVLYRGGLPTKRCSICGNICGLQELQFKATLHPGLKTTAKLSRTLQNRLQPVNPAMGISGKRGFYHSMIYNNNILFFNKEERWRILMM